jgi:serine/threonine protein kinase
MAGIGKWGEGNVERGLREDQEQLAMGKRRFGGAGAGGSGFGGEDAATLWELLPPAVKDQYSLVSELGRGTYGTVILAENRNASALPRRVAVKLCKPNESEMGMMLKEGMAMQRLNSPMIARLVDMGCTASGGGIVYTVLELLEGKSLNDIVSERGWEGERECVCV